jgi:hypothetical protein
MTKPHETWTVVSHGPLEKLGRNLYTVTGKLAMPLGETTRRMTVARLANGDVLLYSPIALAEPEMQQLDALGPVRYLVAPRGNHRLDLKGYQARYPMAMVVAPAGAKDDVAEVVAVDRTSLDTHDPDVVVEAVPGTAERELLLMVTTETGKTLAVADLIFNLPEIPGIAGLGLKILGFKPGHAVQPWIVKRGLVDDEAAMKQFLARCAADPALERILPAHGEVIEDPRAILRELSGST